MPFYDFVQVIIVLIQSTTVHEIRHHSTFCRCELAHILYFGILLRGFFFALRRARKASDTRVTDDEAQGTMGRRKYLSRERRLGTRQRFRQCCARTVHTSQNNFDSFYFAHRQDILDNIKGPYPLPYPILRNPIPYTILWDPIPYPILRDPIPYPILRDHIPYPILMDHIPYPILPYPTLS